MDLFPTLVKEYDLREWIQRTRQVCVKDETTRWHNLHHKGVASNVADNIFAHPLLREFTIEVKKNIMDYCNIVGLKDPGFLQGWYNIHEEGGHTGVHRHVYSMVSGTYYPKYKSGKLYFVNPIQAHHMSFKFSNPDTKYSRYEQEIDIKEGYMYVFPSWLEHGTRATDHERIVMSFDASPHVPDFTGKFIPFN